MRAPTLSVDAAPTLPDPVRLQAFEWQVTLWSGETTASEQAAFARWLAADPAHALAWHQVQRLDDRLQDLPREIAAGLLRTQRPAAGRRRLLGTLGLVAGVGVLAYGVQRSPQWAMATAGHRTATGERHQLRLPDGTRLLLNTASAVDLDFSGQQRRVLLRAGEIQVVTAADTHNPPRPFVVETAHGTARPLGTRFTVRVLAGMSQVAVFEGVVQVASHQASAAHVQVAAGQQARFSAQAVESVSPVTAQTEAWATGRLVAERMRLADFLAELARYRSGVLRCDPAIADLAVSGVYPLDDTDRVLDALGRALPVRVQRFTRYWITVGPH